ncbi:mechanosensitive ion channel family protein [Nannocystis radixulma]|uniref:Mechanosensitive ion channel family protein n=1 Tax=Nannocystis radixulma TaxID=2995305 RepID=A0ABT5AZX4_9BACT|nr:mechanosensitive ion channel family protein [Nannocystis radixulma]MDC0666773.1 mechanosensitive ion channel family protein [Nannocystis radixulma]
MLVAAELLPDISAVFQQYILPFAWKALGAIILWVVGGIVIAGAGRVVRSAMTARGIDSTFSNYLNSALSVLLKIVLMVAILGIFGVESTSFAAVLAAAGVAIGMAWSGLLANFAAGIFLVVLRPFKVGDAITGGGVTGDVREIGLFATTIDTGDGVRVFIGNNKLFADNIVNYSANPARRVDLRAQLAHGVDARQVAAALLARIKQIPNVVQSPAPTVDILEFNAAGTLLYVRPFCNNLHYGQVIDDTQRVIAEVTGGLPVPAPHHVEHRAN